MAELRQVYRIEVLDGSKMAINGIVLPNSQYTGCDEEQIATALGYVCHLVHLLSQYLDVRSRVGICIYISALFTAKKRI